MGGVFSKPKAPTPQPDPSFNTDSQGRLVSNLTGKPPTIVAAPTTAEISQSSATDADGSSTSVKTNGSSTSVKTKRKGRSATILTSPTGVEGDATLGKKSLLGE